MTNYVKFPHTPYLLKIGNEVLRDDKVLTRQQRQAYFNQNVFVEEKVDGANIGLSIRDDGYIQVQNRGNFISEPFTGQFSQLRDWIARHSLDLKSMLLDRYILFGEWLQAVHSIEYHNLPDWFLAFDIYDKLKGRFLSHQQRHILLSDTTLHEVPNYGYYVFRSNEDVKEFLANCQSHFSEGPPEGIYLRIEDHDYLNSRAKLVRHDFIQQIEEHWSRKTLRFNHLKYDD